MAALNNLIPMADQDGNRTFVNSWDVPQRKAQGWQVLGDMDHHVSRTTAPVDELTSTDKKLSGGSRPVKDKA